MHRASSSVGIVKTTVGPGGLMRGAAGRAVSSRCPGPQRQRPPALWTVLRRSPAGSPSDGAGAATRRDTNVAAGADHGSCADRARGLAGARRHPQTHGGWALSRQAVLFIKGASAATFASTAVVAACAGRGDGGAEAAPESTVVSLTR